MYFLSTSTTKYFEDFCFLYSLIYLIGRKVDKNFIFFHFPVVAL